MGWFRNVLSAVVLGAAAAATLPAGVADAAHIGIYIGPGPVWNPGPGGIYIGPGGLHYRPWYEPGWYYYGDYYYYRPHNRRYCLTGPRRATMRVRHHGRIYYLRPC